MSHQPEDPAVTAEWEAEKAATAQRASQCRAEHPASGRNPGDRIVACLLERGHPGEHQEVDTGTTWPQADADPPPATTACGAQFPGIPDQTCTLQPGHQGVHHHAGDVRGYTWSDPTPAVMRPRLPEDALLRHPRPDPRRRHDMHGLTTDQQLRLHGLREAIRWAGLTWTGITDEKQLLQCADDVFAAYIRDGSRPDAPAGPQPPPSDKSWIEMHSTRQAP